MLEKMRMTLSALEAQLQTLWTDYLANKPGDWLHDRRKAAAQLGEMRTVRSVVHVIQDHIDNIYLVLSDPILDPRSKKEN